MSENRDRVSAPGLGQKASNSTYRQRDETPPARVLIGLPLNEVPAESGTLSFYWKGDSRVLWQVLFLWGIGVGMYFAGIVPAFVVAAAGALLFVAGILSGLLVTELVLDLARRTYEIRRGMLPLPSRVEGTFDDFHCVAVIADPTGGWHIGLQPGGSGRAYGLAHADQIEAARRLGDSFASRLGLALQLPPEPRTEAPDNVTSPPLADRLEERSILEGTEIALPRSLLWIEYLRLTRDRLGYGVRWAVLRSIFTDALTWVPWQSVGEIVVETRAASRGGSAAWRMKAGWRDDASRHWRWRLNELKRTQVEPPWWWNTFFVVSEFPCETQKALKIRFYGRPAIEIGSRLRRDELARLCQRLIDARVAGAGEFPQ